MKVLHVIPSYEPAWAFGGTVTATSNLCRGLAKKGIDVTVYTTDADGKGGHLDVPLNEPIDLGGVKVWYFHCDLFPKKAFYSRGLAIKLRETVKDFDLLHVSAVWQYIQRDVYKVCNSFKKLYIITAHGSFNTWPWNQNIIKKRLYWYMFCRKSIENAAALHFTSEEERIKSFLTVALLKKKSSFIVPNGIEIKSKLPIEKDIRADLRIPRETFLLLYIGRIHRKKGLEFIINAIKRIKDENVSLLIVGNPEDMAYLRYLRNISNELENKVVWYKQVEKNRVWDFYRAANLVVLTSFDENFGYTVVESMYCGTPVLVSRNVCIWREIETDKAGFAVNQDINEVAEVIIKLIKNPNLLQDMSINARKSAEKRYDINKVADLMIKAYEDVLTGRRSPELHWR